MTWWSAAESTTQGSGSSAVTTKYDYDPLNRVTSQTTGTNTTSYSYLGLTGQVSSETDPGGITKTYGYTPDGTRVFQATAGNTTTPSLNGTAYYSYSNHGDVEALTGPSGTPTATYGYTAYGSPITSMFTGADKTNANPGPNVVPYNSYRFNAMPWDSSSGQYNMDFRNYDPGIGSFTTRDMYAGSSADMALTGDPFSGGAYAFGDANPISNTEQDGHNACSWLPVGCGTITKVVNTGRSALSTAYHWAVNTGSNLISDAITAAKAGLRFVARAAVWVIIHHSQIQSAILHTGELIAGATIAAAGTDLEGIGAAVCVLGGIETVGVACAGGAVIAGIGAIITTGGLALAGVGASGLGGDLGAMTESNTSGSGGISPRDVHGALRGSQRDIAWQEIWDDPDSEMLYQDDGEIVKILSNGDGTYRVVVRDLSNPSGEPITVLQRLTQKELDENLRSGKWAG